MKIVLIAIAGVLTLGIVFMIWRYTVTIRGAYKRDCAIAALIAPVIEAIENGEAVHDAAIATLAQRLDTRCALYRALHEIGQPERFPKKWAALERIAEADLAVWLMHPNELRALPDEIELAGVFEREAGEPPAPCRYFVFKYRMLAPHWAAEEGWMAGAAGPYWDDEAPLFPPCGVFSRFEPFEEATPEEHLRRVEEIIEHFLD